MAQKPVAPNITRAPKPVIEAINALKPVTKSPSKIYWSFSFKYFNQINYFGLDRVEPKWFVSFIERLKALANEELERFFTDMDKRIANRFHKIDWESRNVPIKRSDLNWIDKAYLQNDEEYPMYQCQISKANGRIVGFWNENHTIFYIVLLDPLHNIQPSRDYDYSVDDCYPLSCKYTSLIIDLENIKKKNECGEGCKTLLELHKVPTQSNFSNALVAYLDNEFLEALNNQLKSKTFSEILEEAILKNL